MLCLVDLLAAAAPGCPLPSLLLAERPLLLAAPASIPAPRSETAGTPWRLAPLLFNHRANVKWVVPEIKLGFVFTSKLVRFGFGTSCTWKELESPSPLLPHVTTELAQPRCTPPVIRSPRLRPPRSQMKKSGKSDEVMTKDINKFMNHETTD